MRSHIVLSMARERAISRHTPLQPEPLRLTHEQGNREGSDLERPPVSPKTGNRLWLQTSFVTAGSASARVLPFLSMFRVIIHNIVEWTGPAWRSSPLRNLYKSIQFSTQSVNTTWVPGPGLGARVMHECCSQGLPSKHSHFSAWNRPKNWPTIGKTDRRYRKKERDCRKSMGGGWWREWLTSEN